MNSISKTSNKSIITQPLFSPFVNCPKEIIIEIFKYLDQLKDMKVVLVCHKFHLIAKNMKLKEQLVNVCWQRIFSQRIKEFDSDMGSGKADRSNIWLNTIQNLDQQFNLQGISLLMIESLQNKQINPSTDNNYAIRRASAKGHLDVVKVLLADSRIDPSVDNNYAIRSASENGHPEVVKELLKDKRVNPADRDNYAMQWASAKGHLEVVKVLLSDSRVNPSADNTYAIQLASENGHLDVVKELLKDKRVDPSAYNNYAILRASENGHLDVVKELLTDPRVEPLTDLNRCPNHVIKFFKDYRIQHPERYPWTFAWIKFWLGLNME